MEPVKRTEGRTCPLVEKRYIRRTSLVHLPDSKRGYSWSNREEAPVMPLFFAFAAMLSAAIPEATQPRPTDSQAIVVEGTRDPKRRANDYLEKVLPSGFDVEIGRFEDPLCPRVVGLPDNLRDQVLFRIAEVAQAANIPVNAKTCEANLLIIVVDDKKALIEGMRHKKEAYLYGLGSDTISSLENAKRPVAAWQVTDVVGADGMPLRTDGDGFPRLFTTMPPSRVIQNTRRRVLGGVIVLEHRGLVGVSTRQLADYALLRLLTPLNTRERAAPNGSVLSLFNDGVQPAEAPQSLTWWDLAYLKALTDTRGDLVPDLQRSNMRNKMVEEMAKLPATQ